MGRLGVVFANSGIAKYAPLGSIDEPHFDSIFDSNEKGLLCTVQKALPLGPDGGSFLPYRWLAPKDWARIVSIRRPKRRSAPSRALAGRILKRAGYEWPDRYQGIARVDRQLSSQPGPLKGIQLHGAAR